MSTKNANRLNLAAIGKLLSRGYTIEDLADLGYLGTLSADIEVAEAETEVVAKPTPTTTTMYHCMRTGREAKLIMQDVDFKEDEQAAHSIIYALDESYGGDWVVVMSDA